MKLYSIVVLPLFLVAALIMKEIDADSDSTSIISDTINTITIQIREGPSLNACECDNTGECVLNPVAKNQKSVIDICVSTPESNEFVIANIKELKILSDTVESVVIENSEPNQFTTSFSTNGGKMEKIKTELVSEFFNELDAGETVPISIQGTAVMGFASSSSSSSIASSGRSRILRLEVPVLNKAETSHTHTHTHKTMKSKRKSKSKTQ
jgi:hypothetical protein